MEPTVSARNLFHAYGDGPRRKTILHDVTIEVRPGELTLITGPSGSGKTTLLTLIGALRAVRAETCPKKVYGCEVWRDLDWLMDEDKQPLAVSGRGNIAAALLGVFDSQVSGGKRYDLATAGRRLAHATYFASHGTDRESALNFAMDLTPLVEDPGLSIADYVVGFVDRFRADVERRLIE